jgi:hypothetical protein
VERAVTEHGVSERFTCRILGQHRSTQRKSPKPRDDEAALTADVIALAIQYGWYGHCCITKMLCTSRLDGELQTGGTDLATRWAESARQTTETPEAVAQRWIVHPSAAGVLEPRLVL